MSFHNYKKNKLEKIKAFCSVVEHGSIARASESLSIASSSVSMQILSLEQDLSIKLFNRESGQLKLNAAGRQYYIMAKKIVNEVESFFNNQLDYVNSAPNKWSIFIIEISHLYRSKKRIVARKIKKWSFSAIKYLIFLSVAGALGIFYYLSYTNYFFDRKIYNYANPLLKNVIKDGYMVISENIICSFGVTQLNLDMYSMVMKLTSEKKYKNLPITMFLVADSPLISMRFTGNEKIDRVFRDKEYSTCNTEKTYLAGVRHFFDAKTMFARDSNFRIYNLYNKPIDNCLHCNYFLDNLKNYPKQLFGIYTNNSVFIEPSRGWIIKYGHYYYLLSMTNIVLTDNMANSDPYANKHKRHIVWKKMTEKEFMNYNAGSYWKMITGYNIKV